MKKKYKLHIELLRYILDNENPFTEVDLKPFLLKTFDTSEVKVYMKNIRCFVEGLEKSGLIEIVSRHDLKITTTNTRITDFYVNARITLDGTKYISDQNIKRLNRTSVYTSITIGVIVAFTSVATFISNSNRDKNISNEINDSVRKQLENITIDKKETIHIKLDTIPKHLHILNK